MNRRTAVVLAVVLGAVAVVIYLQRGRGERTSVVETSQLGDPSTNAAIIKPPASNHALASSSGADSTVAPDAVTAAPARSTLQAPTPADVAPTPESASLPETTVLENMRRTIRQYASAFGENPVGTNPEITASLQGNNSKHINFLREDGNRVNSNGELVDVWGTPYFFHQLSAQEMEIRSAGPDRVMYTGDDLVTR